VFSFPRIIWRVMQLGGAFVGYRSGSVWSDRIGCSAGRQLFLGSTAGCSRGSSQAKGNPGFVNVGEQASQKVQDSDYGSKFVSVSFEGDH